MSPLWEMASTASPLTMRPRSPWMASAGCRNSDGVPVEASVAETFWPIRPLLPIPVTTTRPAQPRRSSTARSKPRVDPRQQLEDGPRLDLQDLARGLTGHAES